MIFEISSSVQSGKNILFMIVGGIKSFQKESIIQNETIILFAFHYA